MTTMRVATVGVHILDTHVVGVESVPPESEGQLVEAICLSAAGTAGGTALVLARLGASVATFGAVGTDPMATVLVDLLQQEGVDVSGLVRKPGTPTSASIIPVRPNGDRPAWHAIGANGVFTLEDLPFDRLEGITHLHLGGPEFLGGEASGRLLAHARSIGATTSMDLLAIGDPEMLGWIGEALPLTDYFLPNADQVLGLTGADTLLDGARQLVAAGVGCVAATRGSDGVLLVTPDDVIEVPAHDVAVVDTTGCGDAFSAGFLRGLALGRDLRAAAQLGCATAAGVAGGLGTDAGVYSLETVLELADTVD